MERSKESIREQIDLEEQLQQVLKDIDHRWLVLSGKGGVGKSTVAVNLALALAQRGYRVGIIDVDLHGPNVAKNLGIEGQLLAPSARGGIQPIEALPNLFVLSMASLLPDSDTPVIWRGPKKYGAIRQFLADGEWGHLDHLVIDSPPGTGDEPLAAAQLLGDVDGAIIVTTPQELALLDSRKCVNFSHQVKVPVTGIIENMSGLRCPHCGENIDIFGRGGGELAAQELKVPFLGRLPFEPSCVPLADAGKPFLASNPDAPLQTEFQKIVGRILESQRALPKKD